MREIKFRAWDKTNKRMLFVSEMSWFEEYIESQNPFCILNFAEIELMQFTGLLDKNGKEIYEGDIVKNWQGISTVTFSMGAEGEPADYVGVYQGWCVGDKERWETNGFMGKDVEIIGNVYENPNLIK